MSENRIAPAANWGESKENTEGNRFDSNSTAVRTYPAEIVLTATAETYLENLAVDLCLGRVELRQLPPSLLALYTFAHEHGRASVEGVLRPRIRRLEYERDLYYFCYVNRKTPADYRRAQTAELWRQGSEVAT